VNWAGLVPGMASFPSGLSTRNMAGTGSGGNPE
jgi:hypothetical protein